jgi:hypothetical protein
MKAITNGINVTAAKLKLKPLESGLAVVINTTGPEIKV